MSVRLSLEYRLESLYFNNFADEMLLKREHQYVKNGIQRTGRSTGHLDVAAKFITWFEHNELGEDDFDEVDEVIGDPIYVPTI
jgi:beta-galactosidase GanA